MTYQISFLKIGRQFGRTKRKRIVWHQLEINTLESKVNKASTIFKKHGWTVTKLPSVVSWPGKLVDRIKYDAINYIICWHSGFYNITVHLVSQFLNIRWKLTQQLKPVLSTLNVKSLHNTITTLAYRCKPLKEKQHSLKTHKCTPPLTFKQPPSSP